MNHPRYVYGWRFDAILGALPKLPCRQGDSCTRPLAVAVALTVDVKSAIGVTPGFLPRSAVPLSAGVVVA